MPLQSLSLYVGQTHPIIAGTWLDDAGKAKDLTGATLTLRLLLPASNAAGVAGVGTFALPNPVGGQFTYALHVNDVALANAGWGWVQFKAVFPDATVDWSDPIGIVLTKTI